MCVCVCVFCEQLLSKTRLFLTSCSLNYVNSNLEVACNYTLTF